MAAPTPKIIRSCFQEYRNAWDEIRQAGARSMAAVMGDTWDPEDRAQREDAGRPCIALDELNQYLNQYLNNLRQNPRAIQTMPKGDGANDKDAEKRSSLIKGIEERSNAQLAYINAAQCAAERGYGYSVIRTEYKDEDSFNQEIIIKPILNPDTVLLTPDYKQPDASDICDAFLLDLIPKTQFKERFPDAKITDFSDEDVTETGVTDWVKEKHVQVAEYWKIEHDLKTLLLVEKDGSPIILTAEKYKQLGKGGEVKRERKVEVPRVVQYLTNGVEILDTVDWAGSRIPIISCFGLERWITEGGVAKRKLLSMVSLAIDAQMMLNYFSTQECEEAGQIPKAPFVGYKGQFESDKDAWTTVTKQPHAFLQADIVIDGFTGTPLPIPQRPQWTPNFQQYEIAKDSARRSIQAAMGITPLPTAAQRQSEKSGIALEKIQNQEAIGSLHFRDNYDRFLHNMGWQINELLPLIYDTQDEIAVASPDGKRTTMHLVGKTSNPIGEDGSYEVQDQDGQPLPEDHLHTGKGDFDVTISTGPSYQSEREEQSSFVDKLIENAPNLPPPGTPAAKVLALGIRMKPELGPIGKQIADVFDPPPTDNLPPEAQAIVQQLQGQMQQLQQENQALHMDRAGRVLERQTKIQLQQMKEHGDNLRAQLEADLKAYIANVTTKQQSESERATLYAETQKENNHAAHDAAHDYALQKDQQAHEQSQAQLAAQQAQASQATQIAAEQQAAQNKPAE